LNYFGVLSLDEIAVTAGIIDSTCCC